MRLLVGTSGFSYPKWKGPFYPAKLPAKQFLRYYGERFRAVEINNTFYRPPTPTLLEAWAADVPADFRFVLKAPQKITHVRRLRNAAADVASLVDAAGVLKDRLGPVLFQLPPNFAKDADRLRDFLAAVPATARVAFEFRHPSWFDDDVFALLRGRNVALCLAEADDELTVPFVATADWGYLRLRKPDYPDAELMAWAERVSGQPWQDAFVFFKHEDEGTGPRYAARFLELAAT